MQNREEHIWYVVKIWTKLNCTEQNKMAEFYYYNDKLGYVTVNFFVNEVTVMKT